MPVLADLQEILEEAVASRGLPGATVAVLADGEVTEAAAGVLNQRTGVEATPESLFQIGSITKVYTATLVMQLVDAGLVDLDAPVRTYLPEFRVADEAAAVAITVRQLLTHTSGFDGGDHFFDGGSGDDTLARFVESLAVKGQISRPGEWWSYNNSGFAVLGRIIEVVTGEAWSDVIRTRLLAPAGLDHSVTLPEEAMLFRVAAGHQAREGGTELVKEWWLGRTSGPAGGVIAAARDVVGFARVHLEDGRGLLSPASVKAMQQPQVTFPGETDTSCGLAWIIRDIDGVRTIGHNGGTLGQSAFLSVIPDRGTAIAVLTNGPTGGPVAQAVNEHVTSALGLPSLKPTFPKVPETPPALDLSKYVGRYERTAVHITIGVEDDHLTMAAEYVDIGYDLQPPPPVTLVAVDAGTFVVLNGEGEAVQAARFFEFDDEGRPQLFFSARMGRRVS